MHVAQNTLMNGTVTGGFSQVQALNGGRVSRTRKSLRGGLANTGSELNKSGVADGGGDDTSFNINNPLKFGQNTG